VLSRFVAYCESVRSRQAGVLEVGVARWGRRPGAVRLTRVCSLAAGCAAAATAVAACSSATPQQLGYPSAAPTTVQTASLTADGRTQATLDVLTGTTALTIDVADFGPGGSLLRVSTPAGQQAARLSVSDPAGSAGPGENALVDLSAANASAVTVTLSSAVSWQLDLDGGSTRTDVDLRGGQVTGIQFNAGSSVINLALPQPHADVPVQMAGGASEFLLSLPNGVPARVTAAGGASEVLLEGQDHTGVAGGSVFTTPGWAPGVTGFDINASAGASQISVTARPS
jgi:hypothetical protein